MHTRMHSHAYTLLACTREVGKQVAVAGFIDRRYKLSEANGRLKELSGLSH